MSNERGVRIVIEGKEKLSGQKKKDFTTSIYDMSCPGVSSVLALATYETIKLFHTFPDSTKITRESISIEKVTIEIMPVQELKKIIEESISNLEPAPDER